MPTITPRPRTAIRRVVGTGSFLALAVVAGLGPAASASAAPVSAAPASAATVSAARALAPCSLCDVSVDDARRSEARSGFWDRGFMNFRVRLDAPAPVDLYVRYTTVNGAGPNRALAGADYRRTTRTLRIAAGTSWATARVLIYNDRRPEFTEHFRLLLLGASGGASIVDRSARGFIIDDDRPRLSVVDAGPVSEDGGPLVFEVKLSRPVRHTVWVRYATHDDSATAGEDYVARSGWLRFGPGTVSRLVRVHVIDDSRFLEGTETMRLVLSNPIRAGIADGTGDGTITENDIVF